MIEDFKIETKEFIEDFHITFLTHLEDIDTIEEALILQGDLKEVLKNINELNELIDKRFYELFEFEV